MKRKSATRGAAIFELAIFLPFIVLVMGVASDCYAIFQSYQYLSLLGRETGNTVFRDCTSSTSTTATNACIQSAADTVFANAIAPGSLYQNIRMHVKVFEYAGAGVNAIERGSYFRGTIPAASTINGAKVSKFKSYIPANRALVTVEVFYRLSTLFPFIPGEVVETTIF